jgi:hypothetical protein
MTSVKTLRFTGICLCLQAYLEVSIMIPTSFKLLLLLFVSQVMATVKLCLSAPNTKYQQAFRRPLTPWVLTTTQ